MANWVVYLGVIVLIQVGSLALAQFGIKQEAKINMGYVYIAPKSRVWMQRKFYIFLEYFGCILFMAICAIEVILVFVGLFFAASQFLQ